MASGQEVGNIVLDENFGKEPFPTHTLTSEQIMQSVNDILAQPVANRADFAAVKHRDFMLLHPRLFRAVTCLDDDFDVALLKHMLAMRDSSKMDPEARDRIVQTELKEKYNVPDVPGAGP